MSRRADQLGSTQCTAALGRNQPSPQNGRQGTSDQGTAALVNNHTSTQGTTLAGYLKTRNPSPYQQQEPTR